MAGPALPTNVTAGATGHTSHTNAVHGLVNKLDVGIGAASPGQILAWNGTVYVPATLSGVTAGAVVAPEAFGAVGNGTTDDSAALTAAIGALRTGDTLRLTKSYKHTGVLTLNKPGVTVNGGGELVGTNQTSCALFITAKSVTVDDITLTCLSTTRQTTPAAGGLIVGPGYPVTGFRSRNLRTKGAGVGILNGSSDFVLENTTVHNSLADGIHMTGGVHHGRVINPTVVHPGDDGVAVVSYLADATPCHDIDIIRPHVKNGYNGRGVTCVGGTNISFFDIDVSQNAGSGVYIACESNGDWNTYPPVNVKVLGGSVDNANMLPPGAGGDHGSVFILNESSTRTVKDVEISGLVVRDCWSIYRNLIVNGNTAGLMSGIVLADIVVQGRTPRLIVGTNNAGNLVQRNICVGVTTFTPHPSETWVTNPNGQLYGARGSTAVLLNGSYWYQPTTGGEAKGWVQLGTAPDTAAPRVPSGVSATAGSGQVTVTWAAAADNVLTTRYYVYRTANNNTRPGEYVGTTTTRSFTSTGLKAGTTYRFGVTALDNAGNESDMSSMVSAVPT